MLWLIPISFVVIFEVIADVFAKEYSLRAGNHFFWYIALIAYLLAGIAWLTTLKDGAGLARGIVIFSIASEVITIFIGLYFFHERLGRAQAFGILLGIIALIFILY